MADTSKLTNADLPPANFQVLVSMFSTQAAVALGLLPHPVTNKQTVELPLAKHFISMLTVLEEKTKRNLTTEEESFLGSVLHRLRTTYLELERVK